MLTIRSLRRYVRKRRAGRGKSPSALFCGILVLLLLAGIYLSAAARLRPMIRKMAQYAVTDMVTRTVSEAVTELIESGRLDYGELITLERDGDGNITALITNMAKINELQDIISDEAINRVSDTLTTQLKIPLGNVIGGPLLSGRGPILPLQVLSVTSSSSRFENRFTAEGINQTRHQIILNMTIDIEIIIPGERLESDVVSEMVIAETIIVGRVPQYSRTV